MGVETAKQAGDCALVEGLLRIDGIGGVGFDDRISIDEPLDFFCQILLSRVSQRQIWLRRIWLAEGADREYQGNEKCAPQSTIIA
jgi:hypothetical protein